LASNKRLRIHFTITVGFQLEFANDMLTWINKSRLLDIIMVWQLTANAMDNETRPTLLPRFQIYKPAGVHSCLNQGVLLKG